MFNPTTIQQCMVSLLGWRNDANPDVPQITDPALLQTDSGLIYNDFHPLLTIENISNTTPDGKTIDDYLNEKVASGISKAVTKVAIEKKLNESTKTLLNSSKLAHQFFFSLAIDIFYVCTFHNDKNIVL